MKGRIKTALTVTSLIVCLAVVALWVRSILVQDMLSCGRRRLTGAGFRFYAIDLYSARGEITGLWEYRDHSGESGGYENRPLSWRTADVKDRYAPAGYGKSSWNIMPGHFGQSRFDQSMPDPARPIRRRTVFTYWRVPYWAITVLTGIVPAWAGARYYRARRRASRGLCVACGYDLRESTDRCPECGRAAASI